ncbi:P-loop containing nucleoside triphosphate hydrolase protein [Hysterangium stoloniferum]|nr:P-loop containing nucleoside triphosphate hydrolase protein [Hysterangium stoloniferum]
MEISAGNGLNRGMPGLWTQHRRTKVNLNASLPPTPPETANNDAPAPVAPADDTPTTETTAAEQAPKSPLPSAKRRVRSSRTTDGVDDRIIKRMKTTSGAVSKDHTPPTTRLSDLGGVQPCIEKMLELVAMPLCHPEVYLHTGVQPPRGVLLHGPPGCGKTLLANAIAGELGLPFISVSAPSIVSGMSGESEKTLRDTFEEAKSVAPCLLFIDEIDAITPKRESAQREMERRIVAQFLTCMDDLSWDKTDNKPVMVIGATNRPDSLDAALRRAGRFDHEISMGVPDDAARAQILRVLCAKLRLSGDFDFKALAKATPGYVGADLAALTGAAGVIAVKRIFQQLSEGTLVLPDDSAPLNNDVAMQVDNAAVPAATVTSLDDESIPPAKPKHIPFASIPDPSIASFFRAHPTPLTATQLTPLFITPSDFIAALSEVQPSSTREGFATVPNVTWADIGALHATRAELHMAIVQPIRRPELFQTLGIEAPCGVLLWGPPGCGKTLLAKAVANESRANFISVKGPELLNKYVGESERAVRQVFARARASSPCVIFFDELDALVPRRDDSLSESSARVVNTLLTELDGLDARKAVYVIAATNRPDMIDPAMCRPGRLDKLLYVDLPTADERAEIVHTMVLTRNIPLAENALPAIEAIVRAKCDGYSGADLAALVREAAVSALRDRIGDLEAGREMAIVQEDGADVRVGVAEFEAALDNLGPSVSRAQRRKYESLRSKFAGLPVKGNRIDGVDDGSEK